MNFFLLFSFSRNFEEALKIMQKATTPPPRKVSYHDEVRRQTSLCLKKVSEYDQEIQQSHTADQPMAL